MTLVFCEGATDMPCFGARVSMDQVDAIGHWAGNVRREIYADKTPKNVGCLITHVTLSCDTQVVCIGCHCSGWLLRW